MKSNVAGTLFSLYMSELGKVVGTTDKQVQVVSYADDSYVVIAPDDINNISELTENTLLKHIKYLRELGMIVNETKTEMMWLGANKLIDHVMIGPTAIPLTNKMKALGIYIQGNLGWDAQAEHVIAKSKKLVFFKPQNINKSRYFLKKNKKFYSQLKLCLFLFIECVIDRPKMI